MVDEPGKGAVAAGTPGETADAIPPVAPESMRLFQLLTVKGDRRWRAAAGHLSVGSHASNDVVLGDATVSRFHCELKTSEPGVWVTDLDSTNGTSIDGIRVKAGLLRHGASIRMGNSELRFERLPDREQLAVSLRPRFGPLVGSSLLMRSLFATLEQAAPTDATVLLEGETGTGKGAVAEALHTASGRRDGPFVVVDCGALAPGLLDSELFGHERGAFTGADARRIGAFEEASGGTIFLDEVGELPPETQPRLLRVLENRAVRRVGQNSYQPVDVRVIAATNRDLRTLVNEGRFRADLYYRLAVLRINIPPLRERMVDLPELAGELLRRLGATPAQLARLTGASVVERLKRSAWPGNVRELRNYIERSLVLEIQPAVEPPLDDATVPLPEARRRAQEAFERRYLEDLMRRHGGKVAVAARASGVARVYLYRLLGKHGMKPGAASDDE